jgi:hypothetical protein
LVLGWRAASLSYRSGWTQEEFAQREAKRSNGWRIAFGRF